MANLILLWSNGFPMSSHLKRIALLGAGLLLAVLLAVFSLVIRYSSELRSLRPWHKLHVATLVRGDNLHGTAWVYGNRKGDYLVLLNENPNFGPYVLTKGEKRVRNCSWTPLGQRGATYIWSPLYIGGSNRCFAMDGVKFPETTWVVDQNSINFYSLPNDWPPEIVGKWRVQR